MDDFKEKRKREARNPYLFLGAGIAIGIVVSALLAAGFLFAGWQESVAVFATPTFDLFAFEATPIPTASPVGFVPSEVPYIAQVVEPTVIAPRVQAAAISPDGRYLATTATDDTATIELRELWVDRNLGGDLTVLYEAPGGNYFDDVLFSPDGSLLLATINNGIALLFDVATKTQIGEFPNIGGAAFNTDGSILALVGANTGIRLIDTKSQTLMAGLELSAYQVGAVSISPQNKLAIALDNQVVIYDIDILLSETRRNDAPVSYQLNSSFAYDLAFHPSGNYLAVSGDGFVQVLNLENNERTNYNFSTSHIYALAFSPSGQWLAIGGGEAGYGEAFLTVFRWDDSAVIPPDPSYYAPVNLVGHEHTVFDVAFTPDDYLLSASWDGSVRLWDLNTNEEISRLQL